MIEFRDVSIDGSHTMLVPTSWNQAVLRKNHWGLYGVSERWGGLTFRTISCYIWLHNEYTNPEDLLQIVDDLHIKVGDHGLLRELKTTDSQGNTYGVEQEFPRCTFDGFEEQPLGDRDFAGGIPIEPETQDFKGWFTAGVLMWTQLAP